MTLAIRQTPASGYAAVPRTATRPPSAAPRERMAPDEFSQTALGPGSADRDQGAPDPGPGRRGPVRQLQMDLKQLGYFQGYTATGGYYHVTREAVRRFQSENGLEATGRVEQDTRDALAEALGGVRQPAPSRNAPTPITLTPPRQPTPAPVPITLTPQAPRVAPQASERAVGAPYDLARISQAQLAYLGRTDKPAFFATLRPGAEEIERQYGVPAAVTLGQIALETGYGAHVPGGDSFNLFGHKGVGPAGSVRQSSFEAQGTRSQVSAFRKYHDFAEAMRDHGQVMASGYYQRALDTVSRGNTDARTFLRNIEGVYHQDGHAYTTNVMGIIERYQLA